MKKKKRETDCRYYFRIWDEKEKCYGLVPYTMPLIGDDTKLVTPVSSDPDRFKIEQCTGLKDSKGDKIFENDVLRLPNEYDNRLMKVVWLSHFCQYRLVPVHSCPCIETLFLSKTLTDYSRIMGNDHQTLFKEDKKKEESKDAKA